MSEDSSISQENTSEQARIFWEGMADSFQGRRRRGRAVVNTVVRDNSGRIVGALASIDGSIDQPLLIDHGQPLATGDVFLVENDGTVSLPQWRSIRKIQSVVAVPNAGEMPSLPTPTNVVLYTGAFIGTPSLPVWAWIGATWDILDSARWGGHIDYELEYCDDTSINDPERLRINYQQSATYTEAVITATDTIIPRSKFVGGLDDHDTFPFKGTISLGPERISYEAVSSRMLETGTNATGGDGSLTDTTQGWSTDIFLDHCLIDSALNMFLITGNDAQVLFFSGQAASGDYEIYPCFSGCTRGADETTASAHSTRRHIVSESAGARFSGLLPGVTYNVRVRAIRFDGAISGWTTWQSIVVQVDEEAPPMPWGFTVTSSLLGVFLDWDGPTQEDTPDLVGFYIWEADDAAGTNETWRAVIGPRTEAMVSLMPNIVSKYYSIQAVDSSNNVSAMTERLPGRKYPTAGSNLLPNADLEAPDPEIPDAWPAHWAPTTHNTLYYTYGQFGIDDGKGWKFAVGKGGDGKALILFGEPLLSGEWRIPAEIDQPYTMSFYYKLIVAEGVPTDPAHLFYVQEDYDAAEDGQFLIKAEIWSHSIFIGGVGEAAPLTTEPVVISEIRDGWVRVQFTFAATGSIFNDTYRNISGFIGLWSKSVDHDITIIFDRIQLEIGGEATPWALGTFTPQGADALRVGPSAIMGGDLHIQGDGSFKSDALPSDDQVQSLGSTDRRWKNIWCQNIYAENLIDMFGDSLGGLITASIGTVYGGTGDCANITSPGADYNTVIGYEAMKFNEIGDRNCIFGYQAGYGVTGQSYEDNVFIGSQAGYACTTAYYNICIGTEAAKSGTTISDNTIIGYKAAHSAIDAYRNIIIGTQAAEGITGGSNNICIGDQAGRSANFGNAIGNVIIGDSAGFSIDGTSGDENILIGNNAGYDLTTGWGNVFVGAYSGQNHTIGDINTFIGYETGEFNTEGEEGVFVGYLAGQANTTEHYNTYIGSYAGTELRGTYNVAVGRYAGAGGRYADYNVFVGGGAGKEVYDGDYNVCIGHNAGMGIDLNSYDESVIIGYEAGKSITTGDGNVFAGYRAGHDILDGYLNVAVGHGAGLELTSGVRNAFVGADAGGDCKTGSDNLFAGYGAGFTGSATDQSGDYNVGLGSYCASSLTTGASNILIGFSAGSALSTQANNVMVGHNAGSLAVTASSVLLGYEAGQNLATDNKLYIANSSTTTPLIYGEFDTPYVEIHGDLGVHTGYGLKHDDGVASGYVLMANGTRYVPTNPVANPTASVGLSAVNGSAVTAMRSDGAPALDQSIAPTWTSVHNFSDNIIQADAKNIQTDQVRARDGDGLKLYDDGGNGIFVEDGGYVGIGVADPVRQLHLHEPSTGLCYLHFTNTSTGVTTSDGSSIGLSGDQLHLLIWQREDADIRFATNATERMKIQNDGYVGIGIGAGTASAKLHVDQSSATGAIPVLTLDQADIDQVLVKVIGAALLSSADRTLVATIDFPSSGSLVGWIQIEIQDNGNRITDGDYYIPIYNAPTNP